MINAECLLDSALIDIQIPSDTILFITGTTGVGKSTIAHRLLSYIPSFLVIEEADLIREVVRGDFRSSINRTLNYLWAKGFLKRALSENELREVLEHSLLHKSTYELSYQEIIEQSTLLVDPLIAVCQRLKSKCLPAIIEGVNISLEALFKEYHINNYFVYSDHMLFINLYLSDSEEHKNRLIKRATEKNESFDISTKIMSSFHNIRVLNQKYHQSAVAYSAKNHLFDNIVQRKGNHIYSIDVFYGNNLCEEDEVKYTIEKILSLIKASFS